jgi:hypothetical protein
MWGDLPCSYGYFERVLLLAEEAWIHPNLDPSNTWCEYFGLIILSSRLQWYIILNGLCTSQWIWIWCLHFGRNFLVMLYYLPDSSSWWKWHNWLWFKLWVLWKMRELSQPWPSSRQDHGTVYVNIWICWFECLHNLFILLIPFLMMVPS